LLSACFIHEKARQVTEAVLFILSVCASAEGITKAAEQCPGEENGQTFEGAINASSEYTNERLPGYLSEEQKTEIATLYNEAYEDEAKGIDTYISDYILLRTGQSDENHDPYVEMLENLTGTTESLYQAVNEFDPGIKYELTALTKQKFGYIAGKGMQYLLSDSDLGRTLREAGEVTAYALTDIMLNWAAGDAPQVTKYALMPCSVNGDYALIARR